MRLSHVRTANRHTRPLFRPAFVVLLLSFGVFTCLTQLRPARAAMLQHDADTRNTIAARALDRTLPADPADSLCFASADDGVTLRESPDSQAVRDAIADALTAGGDTVKLAGYCAGTTFDSDIGDTAVAFITNTLSVLGGYTVTNWTQAFPITQPTVLDALEAGHVLIASAPLTVSGFTVQNGYVNVKSAIYDGAGIYAPVALVVSDMKIYTNTGADYGGGIFADTLWMSNTELIYNDAGTGGAVYVDASVPSRPAPTSPTAPAIDLPNPLNAYVSGSVFYDNFAFEGGGMAAFSAQIRDSQFISNTAEDFGGGLYADYYADVATTSFIDNESWDSNLFCCIPRAQRLSQAKLARPQRASASWLAQRAVQRPSVAFIGGGGAWMGYGDIAGSQFLSNTAYVAGGGLYLEVGAAVTGTDFISNSLFTLPINAPTRTPTQGSAPQVGFTLSTGAGLACNIVVLGARTTLGPSAAQDIGELRVNGGEFSENYSDGNGGGVASFCDTWITGTRFISNTAHNAGGGLMAESDTVIVSNTLFSGNQALTLGSVPLPKPTNAAPRGAARPDALSPGFGGGAWLDGGNVQVLSSRFENNLAEGEGGGLIGFYPLISETIFISNSTTSGALIPTLTAPTTQQPTDFSGNGAGASVLGGAVFGSQFTGNTAAQWGGGLIVYDISTIERSLFVDNQAVDGGGLDIEDSAAVVSITNTIFARNRAESSSGAAIWTLGPLTLLHNSFTAADAMTSSAIYLDKADLAITNTILTQHGVGIDGVGSAVGSHNLFFGNTADVALTDTLAVTLLNSISADPLFINPSGSLGEDFRNSANSLAVDGGLDTDIKDDYAGGARPQGTGPDIGAFETSAVADLAVGIWPLPTSLHPGENLSFTLAVTNTGPDMAYDVLITGAVGSGLSPISCPAVPNCVSDGQRISVTLAQLAPLNTQVLSFGGSVGAASDDDFTVLASAGAQAARDPNPANDYASAQANVRVLADLAVEKRALTPLAIAGQRITYTVVMTNLGPGLAHMVLLTDGLPSALQAVQCQARTGLICTVSVGKAMLSLASLGVGETEAITVSGQVNANAADGSTLTNTATVFATNDITPANNIASVSLPVQAQADLAVSKLALSKTVLAGTALTYTLLVTNSGPSVAQNVLLTDVLPSALQNPACSAPAGSCSVNGNTVSVQFGQLSVNQTQAITITAMVRPEITHGTVLSNSVVASSNALDPNSSNGGGGNMLTPPEATVTIHTQADFSTTIQSVGDFIQEQPGKFDITVRNEGPSAGHQVTVTTVLPDGVSFASNSALVIQAAQGAWTCAASGQTVMCTTPLLLPGATDHITLNVHVSANTASQVLTSVAVQSAEADPQLVNNASSVSTAVVRPTAITLARFDVLGKRVRWVTSAEVNTYGFHLLRSASGQRADAVKVTSQLIPARGRQAGASYEFIDTSADPAVRYTYWLQEIELSGAVLEYGPAQSASGMALLFLPVLGN